MIINRHFNNQLSWRVRYVLYILCGAYAQGQVILVKGQMMYNKSYV